jgi:hypothetical protein
MQIQVWVQRSYNFYRHDFDITWAFLGCRFSTACLPKAGLLLGRDKESIFGGNTKKPSFHSISK